MIALLLAAGLAGAAEPPAEWTRWRDGKSESVAGRFSPFFAALIFELRDGEPRTLEKRGGRWRVRLSTEPAEGVAAGVFSARGSTVAFVGVSTRAFPVGERTELERELGAVAWARGGGRHTVVLHDFSRPDDPRLRRFSVIPYDPRFRVDARVRRSSAPAVELLPTTSGDFREFERAGTVEFELAGAARRLWAYRARGEKGSRMMILMFKDRTNGRSTYKAGRYLFWRLERPWEETDEAPLDLNFAFAPECRYSAAYSCVLPRDRLDAEVRAGERGL